MITAQEVAADWEYDEIKRIPIVDVISEVLFHEYVRGSYDGSAFTLFRDKQGRLMECNGSHCSCFGLEGQWDPEPTFREALLKREWWGVKDKAALAAVIAALPVTEASR